MESPHPQWGRGHAQQVKHIMTPLAITERIKEPGMQVGGSPLRLFYLILERARGGGIFCSAPKIWVSQQCGNCLRCKVFVSHGKQLRFYWNYWQLGNTSQIRAAFAKYFNGDIKVLLWSWVWSYGYILSIIKYYPLNLCLLESALGMGFNFGRLFAIHSFQL